MDCLLNNVQMGLGDLGELQMRSRGTNGRPHTSLLSPVPPSKWVLGLAALDDDPVPCAQAQKNKVLKM